MGYDHGSGSDLVVKYPYLYFSRSSPGNGAVYRTPIVLGSISSLRTPWAHLAIDDTELYLLDSSGVSRMPLDGSPGTTVTTYTNGGNQIRVDDTYVYWTSLNHTYRVLKTGGTAGDVSGSGIIVNRFDVRGGFVYYSSSSGTVTKVPRLGGSSTALAADQTNIRDVAVDDQNVWWTMYANPGGVARIDVNGGTPVTVSTNETSPYYILSDGKYAYWTTPTGIRYAAAAGGPAADLTSGWTNVDVMAMDDECVYFRAIEPSSNLAGFVRIAKPADAQTGTNGAGWGPIPGCPGCERIAANGCDHDTLLTDATNLYWHGGPYGSTGIYTMPLSGGTPTLLVPNNTIYDLVQTSTDLFWSQGGTGSCSIMRVAKTGGSPVTIATPNQCSTTLATDGTNVYLPHYNATGWTMDRVPVQGGTPQLLGAIDPTSSIAVDSSYVYIGSSSPMEITRMPITGGTPTKIASSTGTFTGLQLDSANVYWGESGQISRVPKAGGTTAVVAATASVTAMILDGSAVYWTRLGSVSSAPTAGGTATDLAVDVGNVDDIATDPTYVYWCSTDGSIWRVPKK